MVPRCHPTFALINPDAYHESPRWIKPSPANPCKFMMGPISACLAGMSATVSSVYQWQLQFLCPIIRSFRVVGNDDLICHSTL